MKADLVSLKSWVGGMNGQPREQKEEAACILEVGVATIYRWIKVFLEISGPSISGDDGCILIWEMKKTVS